MDKEALKRQIVDDVHAEFETELREIKRQKTHAEEELESASERWRVERRRLNSEIDRLESTLAETKAPSRRKDGDGKAAGIDPQEIARIQAEADDKFRKATADWEAERSRLAAQIARLEGAVTDAIERSSNPHRFAQPLKEQYEVKLDSAAKERLELEQQILRLRAAWDEDKKKLTAEIFKLRRLAPPSKVMEAKEKLEKLRGRTESIEEVRIHELEDKLTQAHTDILKYQQDAASAREQTRREYAAQLEAANVERLQMEERLVTAGTRETGSQLKDALQGKQIAEERLQQFESQLETAERERTKLEKQLATVTREWETNRQQLQQSLDRAAEQAEKPETKVQLEKALREKQIMEERLQQIEPQLEAAKREHTKVAEQLATASREWETNRQQLQQSLDRVTAEQAEKPETKIQLEKALREKQIAEERLQQFEPQLEVATRERAKVEEQLAAANKEWEANRQQLQQSLDRALAEQTERREARIELEEALREKKIAEERLLLSQDEVQHLKQTISDTRENVTAEVAGQLRRQYDERIQETIEQKTQLSQQLQSASSLLESERSRFAEATSGYRTAASEIESSPTDSTAVQAEVERVQQMIRTIEELIDNPATELSTVIKKNVEKAELDAYVKGILFSTGRGGGI